MDEAPDAGVLMTSKPRFSIRFGSKLFATHLVAVFLVSGSVGAFFYFNAIGSLMHSLRSRLQNSAALLSHAIDVADLDSIQGPADVEKDAFRVNLEKLRKMRRSNPDIAFLYIMRKDGDRTVFVIDSDETDRQAAPGKEYPDPPETMQQGFHQSSVDDQLYRDEWGVFLSGYAPLLNGNGRYLVGLDMNAGEVDAKLRELRLTGLVSLMASVLLALFFAHLLSRGLSRRIVAMAVRCNQIALGRPAERIELRTYDEFDDLTDAYNTMSEKLEASRAETGKALADLREAHDNLEVRVQERTRELEKAVEKVQVLRGLLPICASCKKIRDDQGYWLQVERFVERHTDARFTHGLCPECVGKLYADLDLK